MAVAATAEIISFQALPEDAEARLQADMLFLKAGEAALSGTVAVEYERPSKPQNLLEATRMAKEGDKRGEQMVRTNAHTDVFERTIKAGFMLSVELEQDENGKICQNGQTNETIQFNTAVYLGHSTAMQPRFRAETNNSFRLQIAKDIGSLDDHNFVVISRYPDLSEMPDNVARQNGFFGDTKSMAIQSTSLSGSKLKTESAFVAGVISRGAERRDAEMIGKFGDKIGVDLRKNAADTIDTPLLIPKALMPNGVIDIVQILDEINGGTFFGQDTPPEDYLEFREKCRQRELEMSPIVNKVVAGMIANLDNMHFPTDATAMLDTLSATYTLEHAVTDHRIDARVYGEEAAWYLQDARAHFERGDMLRVQNTLQKALRTEKSSSCPTGTKISVRLDELEKPQFTLYEKDEDEENETLEDCDFISKECPKCGAKDVKTECRNGVYIGACGCRSK